MTDPTPASAASTLPSEAAELREACLTIAAHRFTHADPSETQLESLAAAVNEALAHQEKRLLARVARQARDGARHFTGTKTRGPAALRWFANYLEGGA